MDNKQHLVKPPGFWELPLTTATTGVTQCAQTSRCTMQQTLPAPANDVHSIHLRSSILAEFSLFQFVSTVLLITYRNSGEGSFSRRVAVYSH